MNQDTLSTNHPTSPDATPLPDNRERRERVSSDAPLSPTNANRERRDRVPSNEAPTLANRERRERVSSDAAHDPTKPTGPRTPEGKARSSQNALKHGLRAAKPENAVPGEMRQAYRQLRAEFFYQYQPQGPTESTILDLVILATWQLRRIHEIEIYAPLDYDFDLDPSSFGQHLRLARYRASYERMLHNNLKQLNEIQSRRLLCMAENSVTVPDHLPPGILAKPLFERAESISRWAQGPLRAYVAKRKAELDQKDDQVSPSIRP